MIRQSIFPTNRMKIFCDPEFAIIIIKLMRTYKLCDTIRCLLRRQLSTTVDVQRNGSRENIVAFCLDSMANVKEIVDVESQKLFVYDIF